MPKSPPSSAPVVAEKESSSSTLAESWPRWLVRGLAAIVVIYLAWLAIMLGLRARFPWDLYIWAESPFMTNMLKLDLGQPLFGAPADGNSFVYSPGLEYLTFAILKPLGLQLDIRFCRLVNVMFGVLAGGVAGLAISRVLRAIVPDNRFPRFAWLGGGIAVLAIFKNLTADITHPDNLVMLHTAGVFLLTFWAWREKKFSVALIAMLFAGAGVFAKQILALAFLGPALVFARFNPWGWRRWFLLFCLGAVSAAGALAALAASPNSAFFLLKLLPQQGIHLTRFYWMMIDLLTADRAILLVLGLIAVALLWHSGRAGREYLQFCAVIGIFSVCPNVASYAKTMGIWNNLIIFQLWLVLLVWPAMAIWLSRIVTADHSLAPPEARLFNWMTAGLLVVFVGLLFPPKTPAHPLMYSACAGIQEQVNADIKAGRKVLIGHGMMYLLRAGSREVPLDRANTLLELKAAGFQSLSQFPERLRQRYYDRLYLNVEDWYPAEFLAEVEAHYRVESVVRRPECSNHLETGRYLQLIGDCRILVPREGTGAEPPTRPVPP